MFSHNIGKCEIKSDSHFTVKLVLTKRKKSNGTNYQKIWPNLTYIDN